MATRGALARINEDAIIERIEAGEYASHIAPELGVTKQALQAKLRKHPRYLEAREIGCELRIDRAMAQFDNLQIPRPPMRPRGEDATDEALETWKADYDDWKATVRATDIDLARVEKLFRAVSWQAEREFPHRWGQRSHVTIENVTDLADKLRRAQERVIEHDPGHDAVQLTHSNTDVPTD